MELATKAYFAGEWRLARLIRTPAGRTVACLRGVARFEPGGDDGLVCTEQGALSTAEGRFDASRITRWRFEGGRVLVAFEDGRPFHGFAAEALEADHLCGADMYHVSYRFGPEVWTSTWDVTGPRKDYRMESRYRRRGV